MDIKEAQTTMRQENIDCWLVYDFQKTNPIMRQLLPMDQFISRRVFLIIPAQGAPQILGSKIDNDILGTMPYPVKFYVSWQEMEKSLADLLAMYQVVGLDYSPGCALPVASRIDAGMVEMIKGMGKTVASAANVFQAAAAVWSESALQAHLEDCQIVAGVKDEAFQFISHQLKTGQPVTEFDAQQFIMQRFEALNLFTPYPPIVGVNQHSGDPHYFPAQTKHAPITPGDWILIDLWAKRPGGEYIFADMTWVGYAGSTPTEKHQQIFEIVRDARDKGVSYLEQCTQQSITPQGWQVDDAVREHIDQAGYGQYFFHRTGHSLGPGNIVHGQGANIDNLETHDTRELRPGIGFSIEPGIYLPEFGVRSEINVYLKENGPLVTTPLQQEIICL